MKLTSFLCLLSASGAHAYRNATWERFPSSPTIDIQTTQISLPESKVAALERDLDRNVNFIRTYENTQDDQQLGLTMDWMDSAIDTWRTISWREAEAAMNRHPHFMTNITYDEGEEELQVHFMALFSGRADATPIVLLHGWPGSFLEFMAVLDIIKTRYTPETSPYHIIVPSLPGFTLSAGPPVRSTWRMNDTAAVVDTLMEGLGFSAGYIAQGGDIGSLIAQRLAAMSESCKAIHLNMIPSIQPASVPPPENDTALTPKDHEILARSKVFVETEQAYALEQGSKPATIGFVLSSHPFALLAWLGEKFIAWTDDRTGLDLEDILTHITLYHLTDTISRSFYSYRETSFTIAPGAHIAPHIAKPFGYSRFPFDNTGVPERWARAMGDMMFFRDHEKGGHFAAMELPEALWNDVESFISVVLSNGTLLGA